MWVDTCTHIHANLSMRMRTHARIHSHTLPPYSRSYLVSQQDPQELGSQVLSDGGQIHMV